MARALIPTSDVLAFGTPVVKAGALVLPVHVHGEMHGVRSTVELWQEAARKILALADDTIAKRAMHGSSVAPERLEKYEAAFTDVQRGGMTQVAAAKKHGLNPYSFNGWIHSGRHVATARALATRAPILKPSQRIL